jgi:hypothetical protein
MAAQKDHNAEGTREEARTTEFDTHLQGTRFETLDYGNEEEQFILLTQVVKVSKHNFLLSCAIHFRVELKTILKHAYRGAVVRYLL